MYGREFTPPLNLRASLEEDDCSPLKIDYNDVNKRSSILKEIYEFVRINQLKASNSQANYYNKHHYIKVNYQPGDLVFKKNFKLSSAADKYSAKLVPVFIAPYTVIRKKSPTIYIIRDEIGNDLCYHVRHLRPYFGSGVPGINPERD